MSKVAVNPKDTSRSKTDIAGMIEQNKRLQISIKKLYEKGDKNSQILAEGFEEMQKQNEEFLDKLLKK